jgi:hypothetical protein
MAKSLLAGRRIHIAGSISTDPLVASLEEVRLARDFVRQLVAQLVHKGATFVVPVDAEKLREADGEPICFDWLVWQAIHENIARRPADAKGPLVVAVQHNKNERQIPTEFEVLWEDMRSSDLVYIENVSHWNMNSKRMEAQAKQGDVLLTLGGTEGVLFLANLYHEAGKPVIPLSFALGSEGHGSSRLIELGMSSAQADRLFRVTNLNSHTWMNRMSWTKGKTVDQRIEMTIELLESLEPPVAFVVRLLNSAHKDFNDVQMFFDGVVQPVVEAERGYKLVVVDGEQPFEQSRMDQEIFVRLHRSSLVLADITGDRPNCFLELGYALGRGLPTMLTVKEGAQHPFDIYSVAALHWKTTGTLEERREAFRKHWDAIKSRPALVPPNPLVW